MTKNEGKYLLIVSVLPSTEEEIIGEIPKKLNPSLPSKMRKYLKNSNVNVFLYSRPFRKNQKKSDNEFEVN